MNLEEHEKQLLKSLKDESIDYRPRFWAASEILIDDISKLRKKAINTLLSVFDKQNNWELRETIAHRLGTYCPDDETVLRSLIERMGVDELRASFGIDIAVQSSDGARILLRFLNDSDPIIRKYTLQFFSSGETSVIDDYIEFDVIAEFEQQIVYPEAQQFLDFWLNFYPREC